MDHFSYLCFMSVMLSCLFIAALSSPSGEGLTSCSIVCDVFLCFCHFPMWCPRSGVVFDRIDYMYCVWCEPEPSLLCKISCKISCAGPFMVTDFL